MRAATVMQQLCKSCRTYFMFDCMFYFTCDRFFSDWMTMQHNSMFWSFFAPPCIGLNSQLRHVHGVHKLATQFLAPLSRDCMRYRNKPWLRLGLLIIFIHYYYFFRPPVYGSNGRSYKMLVMFFLFLYTFATRSPRSLGRSPWNLATWSETLWIL